MAKDSKLKAYLKPKTSSDTKKSSMSSYILNFLFDFQPPELTTMEELPEIFYLIF